MAIEAMPLIFKHLGVWLSTCAKTAVRKCILMTDGNQMAHAVIRNALASGAGRLMRGAWVVPEGSSGPCAFFEDGPLKAYVFEHS
jgi:hypothetical protein